MKHGKKPTVKQAMFIQENGYNPGEWLVIKDTSTEMWIMAKNGKPFVVTLYK